MGQCQYCRRDSTTDPLDLSPNKAGKAGMNGHRREFMGQTGSDSALDSGHSYCDEASYGDDVRGSHSSESSGKYSLRESLSCGGDFGDQRDQGGNSSNELEDLPEGEDSREVRSACEDSVRPLHFIFPARKVSRGSTGSERGSITSVSSVTAVLQERLGRSTSLKIRRSRAPETELLKHESSNSMSKQPRRAVSLRLPRSHRRRHEVDTKLPTIYVEESPKARIQKEREPQRKSSLRRALSLLSINSLRQEPPIQQKPQKPVQRILRQPRRRHNTVRGLSGMAIDAANQPMVLQRSSTVYYPTAATLRQTYATRRTYSDNQS
ncbi:hypothetical protein Pmani_026903 [Petrolisthes manimaculis]|uniref:Uncharacterized protein n=1 Tax=Petrolisthes manimaculis TaxID=1843537 RepID=A0AAE1TW94_9EUCA|nr:hypothetical protein Pmani_026903 [Petrolisthes manimaculis]